MHAYNRLPGSGQTTPSPSPPSSPRSPRHRQPRSKPKPHSTVAQRLSWFLISFLLRRQRILLLAPFLYISVMLFYTGKLSLDHVIPLAIKSRLSPGSVYRSPQLYAKLRPHMDADNSSMDAVSFLVFWIIFNYMISPCFFADRLWFSSKYIFTIWLGDMRTIIWIFFNRGKTYIEKLLNNCSV